MVADTNAMIAATLVVAGTSATNLYSNNNILQKVTQGNRKSACLEHLSKLFAESYVGSKMRKGKGGQPVVKTPFSGSRCTTPRSNVTTVSHGTTCSRHCLKTKLNPNHGTVRSDDIVLMSFCDCHILDSCKGPNIMIEPHPLTV